MTIVNEEFTPPIFKVVKGRDVAVAGTRLFVFGKEIEKVESFKYETSYAGVNEFVRTTITITMIGDQVEREWLQPTVSDRV